MKPETFYLYARSMNRQIFNPSVVKHNRFDCHIATAKLCGTHWIKYMLSHVLCDLYNLPPPEHIRDDRIVGHTKTPPAHKQIPQIAVTHSHPHYLLRVPRIFNVLKLPRFVVLVRDPRDMLVSMYEKSKGGHLMKKMGAKEEVSFSRFIRGDASGRTRIGDIWQVILFFNAWGPVAAMHPEQVIQIKYEDLKADTHKILKQVCDHAGIEGATDEIIAAAISKSSKDEMKKKPDKSEDRFEKSVNIGERNFKDWYNDEDRAFFNETCRAYLKYDFGYPVYDWT